MDEQPNLREFLNEVSSFAEEAPASPAKARDPRCRRSARSSRSPARARKSASMPPRWPRFQAHADPSVAMSGQVGSQVKMIVGNSWLIANVRTLRADDDGELVAHVDFLGEGTRIRRGKLSNFRRGVTRYPIPGCDVLPVTTEDLRAIFAASDEPHIEIGTVYPTDDIRGALYVDPMLGKHFAVLGSTGTGKSTSVSLILHRISRAVARGSHRDDRPARRIFRRVQGLRRDFQRRQSAAALLADELRGALRSLPDDPGRGASARRRHPRQVPARRAHQGQGHEPRSARSPSTARSPTC